MAMRLTDTEKWDDDWFLGLSPKLKSAWEYIRDNCDGSGFEKISFKKMSDMIGEEVTREEFDIHFSERVHWLSNEKDTFWISGFVPQQYKQLSPKNPEDPKYNLARFNMVKKIRNQLQGQDLRGKSLLIFNHLEKIYQAWLEAHASLGRGSDEARASLIGNRIKDKGNKNKISEEEEKEILDQVFNQ